MKMISDTQRQRLRDWRTEVVVANHLLPADRISDIENEVKDWPAVRDLMQNTNFCEPFTLYDAGGERTEYSAWRGICHWLWLRHASVHGLFFTPSKMAILQRRACTVGDSPGLLDLTVAGHVESSSIRDALECESIGETNIKLSVNNNIEDMADLEPVGAYDYLEPPRPAEEFYNAEIRFVFAIRITAKALGELFPRDREVSSFVFAPIEETWNMLRGSDIASALQISGPKALYHTMKKWGWTFIDSGTV